MLTNHNRPFVPFSGKAAFGQMQEPVLASDYIARKRKRVANCWLPRDPCPLADEVNPYNLQINLVTKQELKGVAVMASAGNVGVSPVALNPKGIPFLDYVIDPTGSLFGQTNCGLLNFTQYAVPTAEDVSR